MLCCSERRSGSLSSLIYDGGTNKKQSYRGQDRGLRSSSLCFVIQYVTCSPLSSGSFNEPSLLGGIGRGELALLSHTHRTRLNIVGRAYEMRWALGPLFPRFA